jgi:hypothetical protein
VVRHDAHDAARDVPSQDSRRPNCVSIELGRASDIAYDIAYMRDGKMHQTTVRFGPDLWEALEEECRHLGMSAAQYLREAALARLSFTAGRRGDPAYAEALSAAGAAPIQVPEPPDRVDLHAVQSGLRDSRQDGDAVAAQSKQALERSRELRARSDRLRRRVHALRNS